MTTELVARLVLSGVATTLAGMAAERALRDLGRPARGVWAGAMLVSAAFGVMVVSGGRLPFQSPVTFSGLMTATAPAGFGSVERIAGQSGVAGAGLAALAWLALSAVLLATLAIMVARQSRRMRAGRATRLCETDVVVTSALGPAVLGFLRPRIVVPEWLLDRPESERSLVIRHEAEHVAARDPLLAGAALLVACLVPWHPLLWYQLRRLRLAIELDCDARVLRRGDAREYGRLLVDVAERLARGTPLATALAFPRNFLERRIRMITNRRTRPLRAAVLTIGAGALLAVACADSGEPVAAEPADVRLVERPADVRVEIPAGELLPTQRRSAEPGAAPEQVIVGQMRVRSDDWQPTVSPGQLVPFTAELGPDDRPTTIRFEEGTPPEVQERAREALRTQQFRRTVANPDAAVEGVVGVVPDDR